MTAYDYSIMEAFVRILNFHFDESHWKRGSHENHLSDFVNVFNINCKIDEISNEINF